MRLLSSNPIWHRVQAYDSADPTEDLSVIAISDNDARSPSPNSAIQLKPKYEGYDGPSLGMNGNGAIGTPSNARFAPPLGRSDSNSTRLVLKTRNNLPASSSPAPPSSGHPIYFSANGSRRPRPETSHQKAVNINRKMRIDHILHSKIKEQHRIAREERSRNRSSFGLMVMNRIKDLPDMYDSDDRHPHSWGPGGLMPDPEELEDFGEEALSYKKAIDRAMRRLYREENPGSLGSLVKGYRTRKRREQGYAEGDETDGHARKRGDRESRRERDSGALDTAYDRDLAVDEEAQGRSRKRRRDDNGHRMLNGSHDGSRREGALDDLDLALLGEGQDDDDEMDDTSMDDSDVTEDEPYPVRP